jgi:hypothetical protein
MTLNEDIRKTLTDPTPLYFAAGVIDKLREEAPGRFQAVRATDPKEVQAKVTDRAKETQARMNEALGGIDADIKKLREQTQSLALQGLGFAAEYAVKARDVYGELAERGRGAVQNWRGEDADAPEITVERQPVRVAEPPKQERTSTERNGRGATAGTSAGTAKSSTARSTSAKSAAQQSTGSKSTTAQSSSSKSAPSKSSAQKSSAQKNTASKSTGSKGKATGGSATPKSDS